MNDDSWAKFVDIIPCYCDPSFWSTIIRRKVHLLEAMAGLMKMLCLSLCITMNIPHAWAHTCQSITSIFLNPKSNFEFRKFISSSYHRTPLLPSLHLCHLQCTLQQSLLCRQLCQNWSNHTTLTISPKGFHYITNSSLQSLAPLTSLFEANSGLDSRTIILALRRFQLTDFLRCTITCASFYIVPSSFARDVLVENSRITCKYGGEIVPEGGS